MLSHEHGINQGLKKKSVELQHTQQTSETTIERLIKCYDRQGNAVQLEK